MTPIPPELVQLFKDEATTRLTRLSEQLLQMEEHGPAPDLVDSLFRDAHTLKGSAGMMGYRGFAEVAHRMEDLLHGVRSGERAPSSPLIDALLAAVDGLRAQLDAIVDGTVSPAALADLEMRLAVGAQQDPVEPGRERAGAGAPAVPSAAATAPADESFARVPIARVDAMARLAGEASAAHTRAVSALATRLGPGVSLPRDVYQLGAVLNELEARTVQARMVPLAGVVEPLRRAVRDIAKAQNKAVRFEVEGEDTELDRGVLDRLAEALLHLVRNAVDHGIEAPVDRVQRGKKAQALVKVSARQQGKDVVVAVTDDGRGIDLDRVKAAAGRPELTDDEAVEHLFTAGFSTAAEVTDVSGRGVGLDVVRSALLPVQGRADVRTERGRGTTFVLTVPLTVASVPCLVLRCDGHDYALALASVVVTRPAGEGDEPLGAVLGVPVRRPRAAVVVTDGERRRSFSVDELLEERDVVVKGIGALPPVPVVAGAGIGADGTPIVVLDAAGLLDQAPAPAVAPVPEPEAARPIRVLVVDDDAVVREAHAALLTRAGYEVRAAVDGLDALAQLRDQGADLALVDVEMPQLDGLRLTEAIRADPVLRGMAVLMLTALGSEQDRVRGMEAGADGYIVKGTFAAEALVEAVARLLGRD